MRLGLVTAGCVLVTLCSAGWGWADDPVFSGPQVGEPLPAFMADVVVGPGAGERLDVVGGDADASHRLLIVIHQLTRPSVAYARTLGDYAKGREGDGLRTALVFLGDDLTATTQQVTRAQHAMPKGVPVGVSPDGIEGPGSYGLNRNVTLTVLLASDGKVTFNQALVDPSLPVELPKVLRAICDVVGGEPPAVERLLAGRGGMRGQRMNQGGRGAQNSRAGGVERPEGMDQVEPLLRQLIRKESSVETVDRLAARIDTLCEKFPAAGRRVKEIAGRVHSIYGNERAQHHLRRWAGVDAKPGDEGPDDKDGEG